MAQLHIPERSKGVVVEPVATLEVMKKIGPTKAAVAIGTSTTTLYKARTNKSVSRVIEVAAQSVLNDPNFKATPAKLTNSKPHVAKLQIVAAPEPVLMLLEVPADKARIVERLCKALGAKFVEA